MSVSYVIAHSIGRNAMTAGSLERKRVRRCVELGGCLWPWRSRTSMKKLVQMVGTGSAPPVPGVSRPPDPVVLSGSPSPTLPRLALCPTIVQLSLRTRTTAGCYWLAPRCRTISGMQVFVPLPPSLTRLRPLGRLRFPSGKEREREGRGQPNWPVHFGEFNVPRLCRRRRRRWAGAGMPFVRRTRQTGWRGAGLTILCHAI
ncbi:uncharacterized protein B0T23DRAFT_405482 [Neurospora hispaniola]|uniref:Uncharacterized protein n=1 Tax=Neurospora hispaniola TaxID=588809 RepID=A0AAJ0I5K6_9PEZI|nr:hypothetical protein B0T23DRAFT_405482 [Neurospora hispaniola]